MKTYEEMAENVIRRIEIYDKKIKRRNRIIKETVGIVLIIFLMFSVGVNLVTPMYARTIPIIGKVFAYIQDEFGYEGNYSDYADEYCASVVSNGITITVSEVYCDGMDVYIAYTVEGNEFEKTNKEKYFDKQMLAECTYIIEGEKVDDVGTTGFVGGFADDRTYAGVDTLHFYDKAFPDIFNMKIVISAIGLPGLQAGTKDKMIYGYWGFNIDVTCNKSEVKEYIINAENEGHTIDKVIVTPVMITIYTSYPDIYYSRKYWDYHLVIYSDYSPNEPIGQEGIFYPTYSITKIPRYLVGNELDIIVYDFSDITEEDRGYEREVFERIAIVSAHLILE